MIRPPQTVRSAPASNGVAPDDGGDHAARHWWMPSILPGAEPSSTTAAAGAPGALVLHGFTGSPSSVRVIAERLAADGLHVELPLLAGHGTTVDDMLPTRWDDWTETVEAAYAALRGRTDRIVVAGLSMGGSLALHTALTHPEVAGLALINPATQAQAPEIVEMLNELLGDGMEVVPGIGSDIAKPGVVEVAYEGTPLRPLLSLNDEGWTALEGRYGELAMPLLLFTSHDDHVVEPKQSVHLAATYGGTVDHRWLTRSYHVATQDHDADDIVAAVAEFAAAVTAR